MRGVALGFCSGMAGYGCGILVHFFFDGWMGAAASLYLGGGNCLGAGLVVLLLGYGTLVIFW